MVPITKCSLAAIISDTAWWLSPGPGGMSCAITDLAKQCKRFRYFFLTFINYSPGWKKKNNNQNLNLAVLCFYKKKELHIHKCMHRYKETHASMPMDAMNVNIYMIQV